MKHIYNIYKQRAVTIAVLGLVVAVAFPVASQAVVAERGSGASGMCGGSSVSAPTAEEIRYLVIWNQDNSYTAFALEEHPTITYDTAGGTMKCVTSGQEVSFSLADVHKYTLEETVDPLNSIGQTAAETGSFTYAPRGISFSGFAPGGTVAVYSADGGLTASYRIGADGSLSVPTGDWSAGIYLIKTTTATYKIIKK